jgi:hypothetical protein
MSTKQNNNVEDIMQALFSQASVVDNSGGNEFR